MKAPGFVSETMNLVVNEGETIRLPCIVTRLQGFVLLWKKNENIITVGDQILGNTDSRYYLEAKENGNNLVISLAEPGDEGEYECQVSAFKPTQIRHSVKIRVRPSIQTSPVKSLTVKEGEEARLYCRVLAGHPKPTLKWRKKGGIMPMGDKEIIGEDIIFEYVTRNYEGTYECVAEDEYGFEPITSEVQLHVEYAPVIEQEQTYIKTAAGEEIHVTCVVHAYPEPEVVWEKDGKIIGEHANGFVINRSGDRHNLILLDVTNEFFGKYSCQARNALGVASKSTQVSGNYKSYSELSPEKAQTYPELDIRNFYLERFGESDLIKEFSENAEKNSKIDNEKIEGLRIFSYLEHLRKDIHQDRIVNSLKLLRGSTISDSLAKSVGVTTDENLESVDDNLEVDKVQPSLTVTDMKDEKDMTKSFRGSFSKHSDLNEIHNLEKEKVETNTDENLKDIGWGWNSKHKYLDPVNTDLTLEETTYHKESDLNDNGYSGDRNDGDDGDAKKDHQKKETSIQYQHSEFDKETSDMFTQEVSSENPDHQTMHGVTFNQKNKNNENAIANGDDQASSTEMSNSYRGSFSQHSDLDEIADIEDGEKAPVTTDRKTLDNKEGFYSSHRYLDIYEGSSLRNPDSAVIDVQTEESTEESSGEGAPSSGESNKEKKKTTSGHLDQITVGMLSKSVSNNEKDDINEQKPVAGDMYLTTSIVTEKVGETNLETKSPYGKPYIITSVSKEHIFAEEEKYTDEEVNNYSDSFEEKEAENELHWGDKEHVRKDGGSIKLNDRYENDYMTMNEDINTRPYPIEEDVLVTDDEDQRMMPQLFLQPVKQTIKPTPKYTDQSISPLIIHRTKQSEKTTNEKFEDINDEQISPMMIHHTQLETSKDKQTGSTYRRIQDITNKVETEKTVEIKLQLESKEDDDYVTDYVNYENIKTDDKASSVGEIGHGNIIENQRTPIDESGDSELDKSKAQGTMDRSTLSVDIERN